ncbi:MAG: TetR/AcrR family transcriptional regulator [Thermoanaerobaculia bacterium]
MKKPLRTRRGVPTRTADDWEEAALDVIAARGIAALSIPELARTLEVTKGSFYWHFSGLDDLVTLSVKRWESNDKATLDRIRGIEDPSARLRALFTEAMASERAHGLYIALSLSSSPLVSACLRRVNERRLLLLTDSYRELGMAKEAARQQALLTYSAYIGGVHLRRSDAPWLRDPSDVRAYVEHAARALVDRRKPR